MSSALPVVVMVRIGQRDGAGLLSDVTRRAGRVGIGPGVVVVGEYTVVPETSVVAVTDSAVPQAAGKTATVARTAANTCCFEARLLIEPRQLKHFAGGVMTTIPLEPTP